MKRLTPVLVLLLLAVLAIGCGDDGDSDSDMTSDTSGGDLASCAGDYAGTFSGDDQGVAEASLSADGTLNVTFTTSAGNVDANGTVTAGGAVSGTEGATSIDGTMNFGNCTMGGDWTTTGFGGGTWTLALQ